LEDDVKRIDRLITDISDASRLDAELTRGQTSKVDLGVMLTTLVEVYRTTGKLGDIDLAFADDEAGVFLVSGIEARLGQVWCNLIDNAISFSPEGGRIQIGLTVKNRTVFLTVCDQGPGVPEGSEDKIFSRFYSERPTEEQFGSHSGLGLAISKQVIEAHGGTVVVENIATDEGSETGAKFIVTLPLAPA